MRGAVVVLALMLSCISSAVGSDYEAEINAKFSATKSATYPAGDFISHMPFAVGQWVLIGTTDDDEERSLSKLSIVGRDGDYWVLEAWTMNEDNVSISQFEVKGMEQAMQTGSIDDIDFRKIRIKTGDNDPMEITGFILDMSKGVYKEALKSWIQQSSERVSGGAVTVPAGTFTGTTKTHATIVILGDEIEADCWLSPHVPINGIVRTTNSDGYTQVLLDFGTEGARPSF